jgi:prepilin-type N-terminal cleavage/methylation domain-containing protein
MRLPRNNARAGLTLIELIVVMALIVLIVALAYFALPNFQNRNSVTDGADRISSWLLIAKQRAKRDGLPTGVRLVKNAAGNCDTLQYVQQPNPYNPGYCSATNVNAANNAVTATFVGTNFTKAVAAGDYLDLYGGTLHRIAAVTSNTVLQLDPNTTTPLPTPTAGVTGNNYRILRQPRVIGGEQNLTLPAGVAVDLVSTTPIAGVNTPLSNPPQTTAANLEVLFSPSGAVVGEGTPSGQVYLWVRQPDPNQPPPQQIGPDLTAGFGVIVAVQVRSGFISTNQVGPNNDPFYFTRDMRSSGM